LATVPHLRPLLRQRCLINSLRLYAAGRPIAGLNPEDFQVEKDVDKLCTHVCINYFADAKGAAVNHGPRILPDSEYPDWLFNMDVEMNRELEDMDSEKDGSKYWDEWMRRKIAQERRYFRLKYRHLHLQSCPTWDKHSKYSKWKYLER